ncbi:RNA polymerase sigma factor [Streptococcus macedonicus]|uniref:RNA polymerase sigma factor n=2 Tax=Streptococcus TaxID=1301 RepID=A0A2G3NU66_STRMC|nr:RNA polymerase subunit sigma-70 [Streptococcus gallolyticus]EDT46861.1 RNA polymerase sigma factor, sigma-70 family [Streptococcus infantarius subsp. infantarius ATCC BAA-102]PHV56420.1 RNA polymerase sigma factor [Streptococcus macedonicus]PHV57056.1 RNA polymerase sigma factor [Streptococcus macedonicus]PHV59316.1 RNA polymerase sigma factor [Streptococcus macedonicus]
MKREVSRIKLDGYEVELLGFAEEISYYLQKSGASAENARDISQDVLVKMLESEIVLPFEKMRAWMYRVAVRLYIDRYRRDKKYWEILQREFFKDENVIAFDSPDYEPLYQAVALLKEKYRLVIDLYYFQNLSIKEICQVLGISASKAKIDLMRGRRDLQKILEKEGDYYDDFK